MRARHHACNERALRGEEDLLHCILRLDRIAQKETAQAEHHPTVRRKEPAEESAGRPSVGVAGRGELSATRQDGAVAASAAVSGCWRRVVGAYAFVVGCRGWPGRATYGGRRPCTTLRRR